ncbi:helix-turn-helix transcriptional regulator [Massilia cellulosiltytica]|uniref:helix-turn-helix transcriptional regulator n=1 Tax=Massilia cellulosiltytica TaxID=2683234 RepID=UPI0039B3768C
MSKRKPLDKAEARERRNRMLESAAAANLSLTEGVREMRAIAGMTQEEFARHRGVSARVIKAIELGQANPTVATMNRIGQFFGLEVAFVPIRRAARDADLERLLPDDRATQTGAIDVAEGLRVLVETRKELAAQMRELNEMVHDLGAQLGAFSGQHNASEGVAGPSILPSKVQHRVRKAAATRKADTDLKKKSRPA